MIPEKNAKKRSARRIVSLALAVALLCSVVVTQFDQISSFVGGIAEGDPLSRIYSILQGEIDDPTTYDDYYQLASIAIRKGEYAVALEHLDKCEELADADDSAVMADLWLQRASLFMLLEDYDRALPALESALLFDPNSAQALLLRAQLQLDGERMLPAARDMESYLELVPDDTSVLAALAQLYEALSRFDDAARCYDALYALVPDDDTYRLHALRCLFLGGKYEDALAGFDAYIGPEPETTEAEVEAPPQNPLMATAYFLRAASRMQLGGYADAMADFERAQAAGYDEAMCLEQLVACHYALEEYAQAIEVGERLLALASASTALDALNQRLGVAAMSLERYEEAVEYLTASIELNAEMIGNYYYRGVSLLALERQAEAIEDFTASIKQEYLTQFCYYNRGVCHVQLLDYESALNDMEKTLISGDDPSLKDAATNILWQLAQHYENQKLAENQQIQAEQIVE